MIYTSKRLLTAGGACQPECDNFLEKYEEEIGRTLKPNTRIPVDSIVRLATLNDALWTLRNAVPQKDKITALWITRKFAYDCARRALKIFEAKRPDDKRPRKALTLVRRFLNGDAVSVEELRAASDAAYAAAAAADAAYAAYAAAAAADAAYASDAAYAAADAANKQNEQECQKQRLIKLLRDTEATDG